MRRRKRWLKSGCGEPGAEEWMWRARRRRVDVESAAPVKTLAAQWMAPARAGEGTR